MHPILKAAFLPQQVGLPSIGIMIWSLPSQLFILMKTSRNHWEACVDLEVKGWVKVGNVATV
jgi:hypothetical protein